MRPDEGLFVQPKHVADIGFATINLYVDGLRCIQT